MLKKWICMGSVLLTLGLGKELTAQAVSADSSDLEQALKKAPQGISLKGTDAVLTTNTSTSQDHSETEILESKNKKNPGTQIAKITDNLNQIGTIWSKDDNYFELNKPQTMSMWVYLGNGKAKGEGLAFVLQNSNHEEKAMANWHTDNDKISSVTRAESLGVWGVDNNKFQNKSKGIAQTAIQDSWAIEFDSHINFFTDTKAASGKADSFDAMMTGMGPHVASNYPADPGTYEQQRDVGANGIPVVSIFVKNNYYYHLQHKGPIINSPGTNFLANGEWHHLTLKWEPEKSEIARPKVTYIFDDRDPNTNQPREGESYTTDIDLGKIDPQKTNRIRWGFTGTTSVDFSANQLVVFEKAPDLINGKTTTTLKNLTRKTEVKAGDEVFGKDKLELSYHFNYQDGQQPNWANIQSYLKLPTDIDYDKAEVTYSNGQVQNISLDDRQGQSINVFLAEKLNKDVATASIRFTGRAAAVDNRREVASTTSKYTSNVMIGELTTPDFVINPSQELALTITSEQQVSLPVNGTTTITGKVDLDSAAIVAHDEPIWVHVTINGKLQKQKVKVAEDGTFKVTVQANQLQKGDNAIKVMATSGDLRSNTEKVTISCSGYLELTAPSGVSFESKQLTGRHQELKRGGGWELYVQDTRGAGSKWRLSVKAATFVNEAGDHLLGKPVYVTREGKTPIEKEMTPILTHETTEEQAKNQDVYEVTNDWDHQTGMFLSIDDGATAGNYQGKLTWSLDDVPS